MNALHYRVWLLLLILLIGTTGCSDGEKRNLNRRRDQLIQQRGILAIQQAQLQIAIRQDLGGRAPESLSPAEQDQVRASLRGQQLNSVTWQIQTVDREIESVQNDLWELQNRTTP